MYLCSGKQKAAKRKTKIHPNLRAVSNDKERFSINHKCLDVIWFANPQDVDVLDLDELVGRGVTFVNVGASKQLGHNDEKLVVNHHWLADNSGSASIKRNTCYTINIS